MSYCRQQMKKFIYPIVLIMTLSSCGSGQRVELECDSEKYGKFKWHYNSKKVYEMYPDGDARVYKIDSNSGYVISASSKSSDGNVWYLKLDTSIGVVSVSGPYGNYVNGNCRIIN